MRCILNLLSRKKSMLLLLFTFISLYTVEFWVTKKLNQAIAEEVQHFLQHNPAIASIRFEETNAGLLAFMSNTYTLSKVTMNFNHPVFKEPLFIGALSLKHPSFSQKGGLLSGELNIEDLDFKNYLYVLDRQPSTVTVLAKGIIKQEAPLLASIHFKIDPKDQSFVAAFYLHKARATLLEYQATHTHFTLPEGLSTLSQFTQALQNSVLEKTTSEFHFAGNFLDPALTAPLPILQVVAKEMGYYFIKGRFDFKGQFDRQKNRHEANIEWNAEDAFKLSFNSTFQKASKVDLSHLSTLHAQVVSAELVFHDQSIMKKIFPISKVYLNVGQEDFIKMLESLDQKQSSPPLKKALQDLISFLKKPREITIVLHPSEPFDPFEVIQVLKQKNQRNFEQYQQEMTGVNSDETRQKVTEYFAFKQDEAFTEALIKIGFDTQYH